MPYTNRVFRVTHSPFVHRFLAITALLALMLSSAAYAGRAGVQAAGASAGPTSSNTLSIGWNIETKTLSPVDNGPQNPDIWVIVNIYDELIRVAPDGKTLLPDLATSWNMSKSGKIYTFHLRHGVVFQNGQKLTASDVAFCLNRARQSKLLWSWTLAAVKTVKAVNASTVRVILKHPWAPLLSDVSLFDTGIYPEAYFKKVGASGLSSRPMGSGPYMLDTWKHGQYLLLKKNPRYWEASQFPMQYVEYELIPNDNTRLLKVEAGELDVDNLLPPNLIGQVARSSTARVQIDPSTQTNYLVPNHKVKPFGDVNVRQAISHAINRAALVKAILFGHGSPANSFMPRGAIDYDPSLAVPKYSLALAKAYMRKSSVPHGFTMTMEVGSGDAVQNETAVIFKSEVQPLGIKVNIKPMDETTMFNDQNVGKYTFLESLWTNDIPDPDELVSFSVDYSLGSKAFYTWYDNPTLIKLSHQAEQSNSVAQRKHLYYRIQQIFMQQVPFIPLYYVPFVNAVSTKVHGFKEVPLGYFNLRGVHK